MPALLDPVFAQSSLNATFAIFFRRHSLQNNKNAAKKSRTDGERDLWVSKLASLVSARHTVCIGDPDIAIVVEVCGRLHRNQSQSLWRWVRHHDPVDILARSAATRVDRPRQKQVWRLCNCHASRKTDSFGQMGLNQIQLRMSLILNVIFIRLGTQQTNHPRQNYSDTGATSLPASLLEISSCRCFNVEGKRCMELVFKMIEE